MVTIKYGAKKIGLILFLAIIVLTSACGGSSEHTATPKEITKEAPSPVPEVFQVSELAINPAEVNPGVEVMIAAEVTNTSDTEDNYTAKLRIDNVSEESLPSFRYLNEVTIDAGVSRLLSFIVSKNTPATYKVTWGERNGEFVVVKPDESIEPSNPKSITPKFTRAPDFTGVDVVTNERISLSQFSGSIVLLNFVNYGCNPSVNQVVSAQLLAIKELTKQRDDFIPLSIFCGCCPPSALRDFAEENDLSWSWILDTDNSIVPQYGRYLRKYGYPTLIFIDKEQNIREVAGYSNVPTLSAQIDEISQY